MSANRVTFRCFAASVLNVPPTQKDIAHLNPNSQSAHKTILPSEAGEEIHGVVGLRVIRGQTHVLHLQVVTRDSEATLCRQRVERRPAWRHVGS